MSFSTVWSGCVNLICYKSVGATISHIRLLITRTRRQPWWSTERYTCPLNASQRLKPGERHLLKPNLLAAWPAGCHTGRVMIRSRSPKHERAHGASSIRDRERRLPYAPKLNDQGAHSQRAMSKVAQDAQFLPDAQQPEPGCSQTDHSTTQLWQWRRDERSGDTQLTPH